MSPYREPGRQGALTPPPPLLVRLWLRWHAWRVRRCRERFETMRISQARFNWDPPRCACGEHYIEWRYVDWGRGFYGAVVQESLAVRLHRKRLAEDAASRPFVDARGTKP